MISVIVPIYNAEDFLERCIKSILCQTKKEIELILVDDGSTDGSLEICNSFANWDKRVKVLSRENSGVSASRNAGLDIANGDYISFVDADDYIETTMLERLLTTLIKNEVDIAACMSREVDEDGKSCKKFLTDFVKIRYNVKWGGKEFVKSILGNEAAPTVWGKLYRRELVINKRFKENVLAEDMLYLFDIIDEDCSLYFIEDELYNYVQNTKSQTYKFSDVYYENRISNIVNSRETLLRKFGDDIEPYIISAEFKAIVWFLSQMPFSYIKEQNSAYLYAYRRLKSNRYLLFRSRNKLQDKAFLYTFIISKRLAKFVIFVIKSIFGEKIFSR